MKETYDLVKDSHLVAPTLHWMMNAYAKHTELTREELNAYFEARKEKARKEKQK